MTCVAILRHCRLSGGKSKSPRPGRVVTARSARLSLRILQFVFAPACGQRTSAAMHAFLV
jgi:hypothetical protein